MSDTYVICFQKLEPHQEVPYVATLIRESRSYAFIRYERKSHYVNKGSITDSRYGRKTDANKRAATLRKNLKAARMQERKARNETRSSHR